MYKILIGCDNHMRTYVGWAQKLLYFKRDRGRPGKVRKVASKWP